MANWNRFCQQRYYFTILDKVPCDERSERTRAEGDCCARSEAVLCLKIHCLTARKLDVCRLVLRAVMLATLKYDNTKQPSPFFAITICFCRVVVLFLSRDFNSCCSYLQYDGRVRKNQPLCLIHQPLFLSMIASVRNGIRLECRLVKQPSINASSISLTLLWS